MKWAEENVPTLCPRQLVCPGRGQHGGWRCSPNLTAHWPLGGAPCGRVGRAGEVHLCPPLPWPPMSHFQQVTPKWPSDVSPLSLNPRPANHFSFPQVGKLRSKGPGVSQEGKLARRRDLVSHAFSPTDIYWAPFGHWFLMKGPPGPPATRKQPGSRRILSFSPRWGLGGGGGWGRLSKE